MVFQRLALLGISTINPAGSVLRRNQAGFSPSSYKFCSPKLLAKLLASFLILVGLVAARETNAGFASGFSYAVGEEYNDNIFFSNEKNKKNVQDFVTHIVPTFTFFYAPSGEVAPTLTINLSPEAQLFAHNSDLNNFGDNLSFSSGYTYRYSPRLIFHVADTFGRGGATRTTGLGALGPPPQLPGTPTQQPPTGAFIPLPLVQDVGGLVTKGSTVGNFLSFDGAYLYAPNFTISGIYALGYSNGGGASEVSNSIGLRGIYNWRQQHNLHAGYTVTILNSRGSSSGNGQGNNVVHNIDIGDDYFSALKVQIDPTWTLSGSGGIGINTSGGGPEIVPTGSLTLIKVWETATFNIAYRAGLTPSFAGCSGISETNSISSGFGIRVTERLTGILGVDYSLFNTNNVDFKVFRAGTGLQYWFTSWLSSNFSYSYRFRDGGSGAHSNKTSLVTSGQVQGNSALLALSVHFDLWPNLGLARGPMSPLYAPVGVPLYAPLGTPQTLTPQTGQPQPFVPSQSPASP